MPWFVYILLCDQKTFYVGITNDLNERLKEHQSGYSLYTKKFSDIKLVYSERHKFRREAELREQQLKGWSAAKKKALIKNNIRDLIKLSRSRKLGDNG